MTVAPFSRPPLPGFNAYINNYKHNVTQYTCEEDFGVEISCKVQVPVTQQHGHHYTWLKREA